jgi:hypothetical protein
MKKFFLIATMALAAIYGNAQESKQWFNNIKLTGYGMAQYTYNGQKDAESNTFNIRMLRLALDGRIQNDFYWKAQIQFNGNTSTLGNSPRVVDLFTEWQKYDFFRVKIGQFKRPFTFENPLHPIDEGFMGYSQAISKLAGFSDRNGEQASNGRDIGLQIQGDFLKNGEGRNLLHYQIGVFNGQGINTKDVDQRKDVIGGLWVMPVKGMRLGVFGWEGSVARKGTWTDENKVSHTGVRSLPKYRYAISGEYLTNDWTFRSEYVHSTGKAFAKTINSNSDNENCEVNDAIGNKADGFYGMVIAPVISKKLYAKARYDMYRPSATWATSNTQYEAGVNYLINKNVQIDLEYARVNNRAKSDYNIIDAQVDFRF